MANENPFEYFSFTNKEKMYTQKPEATVNAPNLSFLSINIRIHFSKCPKVVVQRAYCVFFLLSNSIPIQFQVSAKSPHCEKLNCDV